MAPVIVLTALLIIGFGLGAMLGAPFLPTHRAVTKRAIDLAGLKPGQRLLDLGCGSGTMLLAAARQGIESTGYEINPWLYLVARLRLWRYRRLVKVVWGDYWQADWSGYDCIYVFLIGHYMARLERRLLELSGPVTVLSYTFKLPKLQPKRTDHGLYLYRLSG